MLLPAVPLGTLTGAEYEEQELKLAAGDIVLVMTDGLAEPMSPAGELFGYQRAAELLTTTRACSASEIVDQMMDAVNSFLAGQDPADDITLLVLVAR